MKQAMSMRTWAIVRDRMKSSRPELATVEAEIAAQIMAQDPTVTRGQALREAAVIAARRAARVER